jgi:hypothetical protein
MSHRHYCDFAGHDWQCGRDCECICGLPMEGHDHSDCPVELRACPEHAAEQARGIVEAMSSDPDAALIQKFHGRESALPHCECGCAEAESTKVVGWCLHCDHVYLDFSLVIQALHFANNCPGASNERKQSAREELAKHRAGKQDFRHEFEAFAAKEQRNTSNMGAITF